MSTISVRFIHQHDVDRWEKLEAKGKLGPRQREMLDEWRRTNGNPAANRLGNALLEAARNEIKRDRKE